VTPPRPDTPRRVGTGTPTNGQPERSISPAPEAKRPTEIAIPSLEPAPILAVDSGWSDAPASDPSIPPPPRRAREQTARGWPPPIQVFVGPQDAPRHHRGQDSEAPKSARQRASEALRSPVVQGLGMLLLGALGGGGGALARDATMGPDPAPETTEAAGEAYQALKDPVANLVADLVANDRADRAAVAWTRDEFAKFDKRLAACEAKLRRAPRDELEPEPPPDAPKPPRTPKLRERLDVTSPAPAKPAGSAE
jgi:hypothetical protein